MTIARVKLIEPFTPTEAALVEQLGEGQRLAVLASVFGVTTDTLRVHTRNAARKIPGTVPAMAKIDLWWRGGTIEALHAWSSGHRHTRYSCACGHCDPTALGIGLRRA